MTRDEHMRAPTIDKQIDKRKTYLCTRTKINQCGIDWVLFAPIIWKIFAKSTLLYIATERRSIIPRLSRVTATSKGNSKFPSLGNYYYRELRFSGPTKSCRNEEVTRIRGCSMCILLVLGRSQGSRISGCPEIEVPLYLQAAFEYSPLSEYSRPLNL